MGVGESQGTIIYLGQFEPMFDNLNMVTAMFKLSGLLTHCLDKGKTISTQTYIKDFLKTVVSAIEKQSLVMHQKYENLA